MAAVTGTMRRSITIIFLLLFSQKPQAEAPQVLSAVSPANRVALLELYTSEGCSSCPPVDRFMTRLKHADISDRQLIPLSFHVTYWDDIGWKDRFGKPQYDERQRKQAIMNASPKVYTPQLMMNGGDYRRYSSFYTDIEHINSQLAAYQLKLTVITQSDSLAAELRISGLLDDKDKVIAYIALFEHGLTSDVTDGENEGEQLHHDYVVRELKGPYVFKQNRFVFNTAFAISDYKIENSGIVAFIQKPRNPEILQAVRLELEQ